MISFSTLCLFLGLGLAHKKHNRQYYSEKVCAFHLFSTGLGSNLTVGQLPGGQIQGGSSNTTATTFYMVYNQLYDWLGRGCWWVYPSSVLVCNLEITDGPPDSLFGIGLDGCLHYNGSATFYSCRAGRFGRVNYYLKKQKDSTCKPAYLVADAACDQQGPPPAPLPPSTPVPAWSNGPWWGTEGFTTVTISTTATTETTLSTSLPCSSSTTVLPLSKATPSFSSSPSAATTATTIPSVLTYTLWTTTHVYTPGGPTTVTTVTLTEVNGAEATVALVVDVRAPEGGSKVLEPREVDGGRPTDDPFWIPPPAPNSWGPKDVVRPVGEAEGEEEAVEGRDVGVGGWGDPMGDPMERPDPGTRKPPRFMDVRPVDKEGEGVVLKGRSVNNGKPTDNPYLTPPPTPKSWVSKDVAHPVGEEDEEEEVVLEGRDVDVGGWVDPRVIPWKDPTRDPRFRRGGPRRSFG